ncbi:MAG: DUF2118 domain-containing protein [Thermoprotei archaeon]|nr:MAG: DUF2118 domain-containing protein [Thermoprotei archaeon]
MTTEYYFPEVFVEGIKSYKYVVETNTNEYIVVPSHIIESYSYKRLFGHVVYEDALRYIDLVKPEIVKSIVVIKKYGGGVMKGMLVEKGVTPCLAEAKGYRVYVEVREGDVIERSDRVAYIITSKGEIRIYRSPCTGLVLLVVNIVWDKPEKYILVVVNRDEAREITIREATRNSV